MIILRDKSFDQTEEAPSRNNKKKNLLVGAGISAGAVPGILVGKNLGRKKAFNRITYGSEPIETVKKLLEAREKDIKAATQFVTEKLPPNSRAIDKYNAIKEVVQPIEDSYRGKMSRAESSFLKKKARIGGTIGGLATAGITAGGIYAVNKYRYRKKNDNTKK